MKLSLCRNGNAYLTVLYLTVYLLLDKLSLCAKYECLKQSHEKRQGGILWRRSGTGHIYPVEDSLSF